MRLLLVCVVLFLVGFTLPITVSFADTETWDPGPPKGVVGNDGIRCHGEVTQDGHTYVYTNYVGADADEPTDREHAWQRSYCQWILEQDMSRYFLVQHNLILDTSKIRVTITRL